MAISLLKAKEIYQFDKEVFGSLSLSPSLSRKFQDEISVFFFPRFRSSVLEDFRKQVSKVYDDFSLKKVSQDAETLVKANSLFCSIRRKFGLPDIEIFPDFYTGDTGRANLVGYENRSIFLGGPLYRIVVLPESFLRSANPNLPILVHELAHATAHVSITLNKKGDLIGVKQGWVVKTASKLPGLSTTSFTLFEEVVATLYERDAYILSQNKCFEIESWESFNPSQIGLSKEKTKVLIGLCSDYSENVKEEAHLKRTEGAASIMVRENRINFLVEVESFSKMSEKPNKRIERCTYSHFMLGILKLAPEIFPEFTKERAETELKSRLLKVQAGLEKPAFLIKQIKKNLGIEGLAFLRALNPYKSSHNFDSLLFKLFIDAKDLSPEKRQLFRKKIYRFFQSATREMVVNYMEKLLDKYEWEKAEAFLEKKSYCLTEEEIRTYKYELEDIESLS